MSEPEATTARRYGWIDSRVRQVAIDTVERLLPHSQSLTAACDQVAQQLGVHPNTVRNWVRGSIVDRTPTAAERALADTRAQLAALSAMNQDLSAALRERS